MQNYNTFTLDTSLIIARKLTLSINKYKLFKLTILKEAGLP